MKIAAFLPNWIGDAVMATPALRAIRNGFPDATITAVMRPYVADVLAGLDLVDQQILCDPKGRSRDRRGWGLIKMLRQESFDCAVLFPNSLRSAWTAWQSGAKRRVGMNRDYRGLLLTDRITPHLKSDPNPVLEEYLRLAKHLGCSVDSRQTELATTIDDERRLDDFFDQHAAGLRQRGYVSLNPGGAFGAAKHWPTEYFGELARRIRVELGLAVVVLCGPAERDEAARIVEFAEHPDVVSLGLVAPSIGLTKAAVKHAALLVTTDSGPRHFAQPFDVPVVTLFGPTHIAWSETFYGKATHLQVDLDCGPCQQRVCPLGHHRCMAELDVDRVFTAVAARLDASVQVHSEVSSPRLWALDAFDQRKSA